MGLQPGGTGWALTSHRAREPPAVHLKARMPPAGWLVDRRERVGTPSIDTATLHPRMGNDAVSHGMGAG